METMHLDENISEIAHSWLNKLSVAFVPGPTTDLLDEFISGLKYHFQKLGNRVLEKPQKGVDVLFTTAPFGEPVNWREAIIFTARRRFQLDRAPTIVTLIHATPLQFESLLGQIEAALQNDIPDPDDFNFPGLAANAHLTFYEQGRRGGSILALERLLQAQSKSIRIILVVGKENPKEAYTFDLVGAYPRSTADDADRFYTDLVLRVMTAVSTHEITDHQVVEKTIPSQIWKSLYTPSAMRDAGKELGKRNFFSEMVSVASLVNVPAVPESISSQYSEGCFASWDPVLKALITTVTGSARPVNKYNLTDEDLAVIVGVRPDNQGALVRHVEDRENTPPSSEAVELIQMDGAIPCVRLSSEWETYYGNLKPDRFEVPVARSKLHGHRGVGSYDPKRVEHVTLDLPYYHYPVSCATEAQAKAITMAFSRSEALTDPADPRQVVFTILPGHGIVIVEKWVEGKSPFQLIWEYIDDGSLEIVSHVPQGVLSFVRRGESRMILQE